MPNFSKDKSGFHLSNPMENVTGVKGKTNELPGMIGVHSDSPMKFSWGKVLDPLGVFNKKNSVFRKKGGGGGAAGGGSGAHTHGPGGAAAGATGEAQAAVAAAPAQGAPAEGAAPAEEETAAPA